MFSSIFDQVKFEHDNMHVYYLPHWLRRDLESSRPLYLIGSRGTGKTTLLKALNWRERLYNTFLRAQLDENPFSDRFIGIYIKLSPRQPEYLSSWLCNEAPQAVPSFTMFYFEVIAVEAMSEALSALLAEGVLCTDPVAERALLSSQLSSWPWLNKLFDSSEVSAHQFYTGIRLFRQQLDPKQACSLDIDAVHLS